MTESRAEKKSEKSRATLISVGFVAILLVTGWSQADTQVVKRKEIVNLALDTGRYEIEKERDPKRGSIYSADHQILAESVDIFAFSLFYERLPKSPAFFADLSEATGLSVMELQQPALRGDKSRFWSNPINYEKSKKIRAVQKKWVADGISLERVLKRNYPLGTPFAGITGLVKDKKPLSGLELGLSATLEGEKGSAKGFVDRTGTFLPIKGEDIKQVINGQDLVLTLDSRLQREAYRAVYDAYAKNKATRACAIVMNCQTGDLLAMVNVPSYDPNIGIEKGTDLNMVHMGRYQPGSTFKPLTVAHAMDEGLVSAGTTMTCGGSVVVARHAIRCSHGAHGTLDMTGVISESCNVSSAQIALNLGHQDMATFLKKAGMYEKVELGLPGSLIGNVADDPSKNLQVSNWGFGQAMTIPPINLAQAFSAIGNHGIVTKPRLIKQIGNEEQKSAQKVQLLSKESADTVLNMMVQTFEDPKGTAHDLEIPGYKLAGKTGTGQKLGSGSGGYMSNFLGFIEDGEEKIMILVMVDNPKNGQYYGGTVAGPAFKEIAKSYFRINQISQN